jgi:hypothetical protein
MEGAGSSEYKKAFWTAEEDRILMDYVKAHGKGKWNRAAKVTGQNFFFLFLFYLSMLKELMLVLVLVACFFYQLKDLNVVV